MSSMGLKKGSGIPFAAGSLLAVGWYYSASSLVSGPMSDPIAIFGAIGVAGLTQIALMRSTARDSTLSMKQQLAAFNTHAIINIVDENNFITEVNDRLVSLTGFSRKELIGQPIKHLYHPESRHLAKEIQASLERGETWQGETPLRRANGATLYTQATIMPLFDKKGSWAGSISARTDVSETNKLIAERHTAQSLYELRDDIWIVDSEDESFTYLNRTAKNRLGWDGIDSKIKSFADIKDDEGATKIISGCRTLREQGKHSTHLETVYLDMPVHVNIKCITGADQATRYLVMISDISGRIEQDKQKSNFVSTVSHELRSPLTSIKGAMGLLLSGSAGELPEKALSLLEIAHRNADRLILIINDILDLEKISNGQMNFKIEDVDVADLVKEAHVATAMLQQRFGVEVDINGVDAPVPFRTDPNRFIQVLTNFLSNAYKFSRSNGRIEIDVSLDDQELRVSVKDEGPGITAVDQYKVFEKFSDLSNSDRASKGGTGLGLNICKTIVESFGGTIGFETTENVGSTFYFILPNTTKSIAQTAPEKFAS